MTAVRRDAAPCGAMRARLRFFTDAGMIAAAIMPASVGAQSPPPAAGSEFCSAFASSEIPVGASKNAYWEPDRIQRHKVATDLENLPAAMVVPIATKRALRPKLRDNVAFPKYYRVIFALINDRTSYQFIDAHADSAFSESSEAWTVRIFAGDPDAADVNRGPPLVIDQSAFGARSGAAPGARSASFSARPQLQYFLSPVIPQGEFAHVVAEEGQAPLIMATHILAVSATGRPLGFYDGESEDPDPGPCFVRIAALESDRPPDDRTEPKVDYADTLQRSIDLRSLKDLPAKGDARPDAALAQSRIDQLTNGVLWIAAEDFSVESRPIVPCTGFMVSPRHIMTARHCIFVRTDNYDCQRLKKDGRCHIRGWLRRLGGETRFKAPDYQDLEIAFRGADKLEAEALERNDLDYAVLRIPDELAAHRPQGYPPPRVFPLLPEGRTPHAFAIPQYPNAREFVISYDRYCGTKFFRSTNGAYVDNSMIATASEPAYRHFCDTSGGSSGSPVFWSDLSRVVGVHVNGWRTTGNPQNGNGAVKMSLIRKDIAKLRDESPDPAVRAHAKEILDYQQKLAEASADWSSYIEGSSSGGGDSGDDDEP